MLGAAQILPGCSSDVDMGASSLIEKMGRGAFEPDSTPMVSGHMLSSSSIETPQIVDLRRNQDLNELSASEPSAGEAGAESMFTLFRYKTHMWSGKGSTSRTC